MKKKTQTNKKQTKKQTNKQKNPVILVQLCRVYINVIKKLYKYK